MSTSPTVLFSKCDAGDSKQLDEIKKTDEDKKRHEAFQEAIRKIESSSNFYKDEISDSEIYRMKEGTGIAVMTRCTGERAQGILSSADSEPNAAYYCYRLVTTFYLGDYDKEIGILPFIIKISADPKKPTMITLFTKKDDKQLYTEENGYEILFSGSEVRLAMKDVVSSLKQEKGYGNF